MSVRQAKSDPPGSVSSRSRSWTWKFFQDKAYLNSNVDKQSATDLVSENLDPLAALL